MDKINNTVKKCGFWYGHNFDKWRISEEWPLENKHGAGCGKIFIQQRHCQDCGFTEINRKKVMIYG